MQRDTLADLLKDPTAVEPAIVSTLPSVAISYRALSNEIERLGQQFLSSGLKPGDCVAMFLGNGLEFLTVFLALTRVRLVAAPLNPAYKGGELRFSLEDSQARAIIAESDNLLAKDVAAAVDVPMWQAAVDSSGRVNVAGVPAKSRDTDAPPVPGDIALFMHTSGTTGRPKVVPLTHANVLSSALHTAAQYSLTAADCSLLVMPLFHGHGLIGAALATLASGGTLIVPPRFSASAFWETFLEHRATWYTAVPTIHQILLMRAASDGAPSGGPRFIRSCSAPFAPAVLSRMESRFGAPVVEAYGMTEASHQVASNPLPPRPRKPGTVGFGTGVEIAIIDGAGKRLAANAPGEVLVRGPNLMSGYLNNPQANASSFIDGYFRTGDLGILDNDGYLAITGRIKDLINRGGEKISPTEIEQALEANPAVAEASVFGVPDAKYGEEVWAAVVPRGETDPSQLQAFCRGRLADFKVPKEIRIVSALPRNAMGKIVRRDIAALFKPTQK
ncbi:MAG TPA: acyl--CoA ligase [Candidatus Binataceae bacterium]|nr:acyl--CoA ligase [Candidatus Binataceae bacterium]